MASEAAEAAAEKARIGNEWNSVCWRAGFGVGYDAGFAAAEAKHVELLESLRWALDEVPISVPLSEQPGDPPELLRTNRCIWCDKEGEWPENADWPSIRHLPDCPWLLAMRRAGLAEPPGQRRKGER